jgi:tRNA (guanine-N7-)-methyltransferase
MLGNSKLVLSNQISPHPYIIDIVKKHSESNYQAPVSAEIFQGFLHVLEIAENYSGIILDSGCGTGESTITLAKLFPDCLIVGVDKSAQRIQKGANVLKKLRLQNCLLLRSDVSFFWQFLIETQTKISEHFILYPNPWPKKKHVLRRWHAHSLFPKILKLSRSMTLRTNWNIYASEFAIASSYLTKNEIKPIEFETKIPITAFERKYKNSNHKIFEVKYLT